jgi:antitoxin YefM
MKTMTYSESRANYAETLDAVINDREEVVITRAGHEPVVIVSLDDYESLKETAYLLRSPENVRRGPQVSLRALRNRTLPAPMNERVSG